MLKVYHSQKLIKVYHLFNYKKSLQLELHHAQIQVVILSFFKKEEKNGYPS